MATMLHCTRCNSVNNRLDHYWYTQNPVAWALLPLSWLFCLVVSIRRLLYRLGLIKRYRAPVPVVIVGNISVGGTGKTPLIIALSDLLMLQGYKVGIISRGYGGKVSGVHAVAVTDSPAVCGDEPLLIKKRTDQPVFISSNRAAAARQLLASSNCDVILSDDGLQHYRLQRDIELAVVDAGRQFGNGYCIPAGPLREPVSRLKQVDMVVYHGDSAHDYHFELVFDQCIKLNSQQTAMIADFAGSPVHAVAGIGRPSRFFEQLKSQGLEVIEHPFPDHYAYTADDLVFGDDLPILMTEKDAVKCGNLDLSNAWAVPVTARLSEKLIRDFSGLIKHI